MIKRNFIAALIAAATLASASLAQASQVDLGEGGQSAPPQYAAEVKFSDPNQGTTATGSHAVPEMSALFPIVGLLVAVGATHILRRRRMARISS